MHGSELKRCRRAAGVSGTAVARKLNCNPSSVSRVERREVVKPATAVRYLKAIEAARIELDSQRRRLLRQLVRQNPVALELTA